MSDALEDKVIEPQIEFENEEFKLEVVEEEGQKDDATMALEAKIAEMEAKQAEYMTTIEGLQNQAPDSNIALAEAIAKMNRPTEVVKAPEQPQVDYAALFESTDKNFYNSPSKSVVDVMSPVLQSMDAKMTEANRANDLKMSKLMVLADESMKGDYIKYKDEVEKLVKTSPPSEEVYAKALKVVKGNHIEDIIAEQVAAKLADMEAKLAAVAEPAKPAPFTNANQVQAAQAPKGDVLRVTARQQEIARKFAIQKGIDWSDPVEQRWTFKYLKGKGVI